MAFLLPKLTTPSGPSCKLPPNPLLKPQLAQPGHGGGKIQGSGSGSGSGAAQVAAAGSRPSVQVHGDQEPGQGRRGSAKVGFLPQPRDGSAHAAGRPARRLRPGTQLRYLPVGKKSHFPLCLLYFSSFWVRPLRIDRDCCMNWIKLD
jgi:hypothetical protein